VDRRKQIQLDGSLPGIGGLILERCGGRTTGIAEKHVEPPQLLGHPVHHRLGLLRHAHVRDEGRRR
jgi:hypothetical protein